MTKAPGNKVAVVTAGEGIPAVVSTTVDINGWARSVMLGEKYVEPNPEYLSRLIAYQTIMAETLEEALSESGIGKLQEMVPDSPAAATPPIEITEIYVTDSDIEGGNPCYLIITGVDLLSGEAVRFSTGATSVQAKLIAFIRHGVWPIRVRFMRGERRDRSGKYLLTVEPSS